MDIYRQQLVRIHVSVMMMLASVSRCKAARVLHVFCFICIRSYLKAYARFRTESYPCP